MYSTNSVILNDLMKQINHLKCRRDRHVAKNEELKHSWYGFTHAWISKGKINRKKKQRAKIQKFFHYVRRKKISDENSWDPYYDDVGSQYSDSESFIDETSNSK